MAEESARDPENNTPPTRSKKYKIEDMEEYCRALEAVGATFSNPS
jgi:hypothetical protein